MENVANIAHLEVALNHEAVFAQIQLRTTGSSYDDCFELFRKNRKRQKVGEYADDMTVEDLINLALVVYEARQLTRPSHECGRYLGFTVQMIFDGGVKTHVDIDPNGEVSEEFEDWYGHTPVDFLEAEHATCKNCAFFRSQTSADGCSGTCIARKYEHPVGSLKLEYLGVEPGNASCEDFYEAPKPERTPRCAVRPRPKAMHKPSAARRAPRRPCRKNT